MAARKLPQVDRRLPPARARKLPLVLAAAYAAIWSLAALSPPDRQTWLLENVLVFAAVGLLAATWRRFPLSDASCVLLFVFLCLHAVGSHYTYSRVPFGDWLQRALGLARNPYDRLVHLAFGLLLAGPARELVLRRLHVHGLAGYLLPVLLLLSASASYELVESWAARFFDPEVGMAYVGAQGDVWDAQKDMTLALAGAATSMLAAWLVRRGTGREPFLPHARRGPPRQAPPGS